MSTDNMTEMSQSDIRFGTVSWSDPRRGFGFIKGDDGKTYHVRATARHAVLQYGVKGRRRLKHGPQIVFGPPTYEPITPSPGTRIMFRAEPSQSARKYPNAYPWGFAPDQEPTTGGQP